MEFKWYNFGDNGIQDGYDIRMAVFCREFGFPPHMEFDDTDKTALHLVCYQDGKAVSAARLFVESEGVYHFGRLCSPIPCRGNGYGKAAVLECVRKMKELGAHKMVLGAMCDKVEFYEKLGFTTFGEQFLEEGIPHIMMEQEF